MLFFNYLSQLSAVCAHALTKIEADRRMSSGSASSLNEGFA